MTNDELAELIQRKKNRMWFSGLSSWDKDDILQQTYIQMHNKLDTYRNVDAVATRIVKRLIMKRVVEMSTERKYCSPMYLFSNSFHTDVPCFRREQRDWCKKIVSLLTRKQAKLVMSVIGEYNRHAPGKPGRPSIKTVSGFGLHTGSCARYHALLKANVVALELGLQSRWLI